MNQLVNFWNNLCITFHVFLQYFGWEFVFPMILRIEMSISDIPPCCFFPDLHRKKWNSLRVQKNSSVCIIISPHEHYFLISRNKCFPPKSSISCVQESAPICVVYVRPLFDIGIILHFFTQLSAFFRQESIISVCFPIFPPICSSCPIHPYFPSVLNFVYVPVSRTPVVIPCNNMFSPLGYYSFLKLIPKVCFGAFLSILFRAICVRFHVSCVACCSGVSMSNVVTTLISHVALEQTDFVFLGEIHTISYNFWI